MSVAASVKTLAGHPWPNGDPSTWVYLDDVATPAEVLPLVEQTCRRYRFWRKNHKDTPRGMLLLMVADPLSAEMDAFLNGMPRSERARVTTWYVFDSDDKVSLL